MPRSWQAEQGLWRQRPKPCRHPGGVGIVPVLSEALGRPALIAALVVMAAALAIWVWRRQRLLEQAA
ncbi:MAG: hypothetical protein MUC34_21585 [Anaerolineae bacterium]|nr:hypothetical protein [Anaerolineae bacterium]